MKPWLVLDEDDLGSDWEDAMTFRAHSAEAAAKEAAEHFDDCDCEGPFQRTLLVKCPRTGAVQKFDITFEYSVTYSARAVDE